MPLIYSTLMESDAKVTARTQLPDSTNADSTIKSTTHARKMEQDLLAQECPPSPTLADDMDSFDERPPLERIWDISQEDDPLITGKLSTKISPLFQPANNFGEMVKLFQERNKGKQPPEKATEDVPRIERARNVPMQRSGSNRAKRVSITRRSCIDDDGEEVEEMSDNPIIQNYAQAIARVGNEVEVSLNTPAFKPFPRPTRDLAEIQRHLREWDPKGWRAQIVLPDGSGLEAHEEFEMAERSAAIQDRLARMDAVEGGWIEQSPNGSLAFFTEEGQRVGAELMKADEERKRKDGE